jgi:hypothetical protein
MGEFMKPPTRDVRIFILAVTVGTLICSWGPTSTARNPSPFLGYAILMGMSFVFGLLEARRAWRWGLAIGFFGQVVGAVLTAVAAYLNDSPPAGIALIPFALIAMMITAVPSVLASVAGGLVRSRLGQSSY